MIFFLLVFQKGNFIKVMTGTVSDPAIMGTPMRRHNQVMSFVAIRNHQIAQKRLCRLPSLWLQLHFTCTAVVTVSADECECKWEWLPLESIEQHNWFTTIHPVPSTESGVLTGKIHSRQFLRGMHINRFKSYRTQLCQRKTELNSQNRRTTILGSQQGNTTRNTLSISQSELETDQFKC